MEIVWKLRFFYRCIHDSFSTDFNWKLGLYWIVVIDVAQAKTCSTVGSELGLLFLSVSLITVTLKRFRCVNSCSGLLHRKIRNFLLVRLDVHQSQNGNGLRVYVFKITAILVQMFFVPIVETQEPKHTHDNWTEVRSNFILMRLCDRKFFFHQTTKKKQQFYVIWGAQISIRLWKIADKEN